VSTEWSAQIEQSIEFLRQLQSQPEKLTELSDAQRIELMRLAGQISRPSKLEIRERNRSLQKVLKKKIRAHDRAARSTTGIRKAREQTVFVAPERALPAAEQTDTSSAELKSPRNCYVCKTEFTKLHFFYDSMCAKCAELNYQKRFQTASLKGQVAVITGGRLKIGYHATLMMLRAGAQVVMSTRFPVDAAQRFARENDFSQWSDRLQIYGLDLRHTPSVEIFCRYLQQKLDRLDILINNAAQTVRRPPGFYTHMLEGELQSFASLPAGVQSILRDYESCKNDLLRLTPSGVDAQKALTVGFASAGPGIGLRASAELSQVPYSYDYDLAVEQVFPKGELDADLQQVDLRTTNSWRLKIDEVPTPEMLEVQLVNSVAPYVLCSRLIPIMKRDFTGQKHIVNVTAMEGKFYRFTKTDRHPHTNMAKAALNMLTHTSASGLAEYGIYMNAVDTGWVTDEDPAQLAEQKQIVHDFQPPLDIVDGAARVCDPFFDGLLTGKHWNGKFLKDYFPTDW
jgi:NAD(P)-dependent dehydrogenase (short-subunit alcohol dehydrogenase family)